MIFRKLAGRWKTKRVGAGERGRESGLIWAVTVTMINGRWKSVMEIRKNTCPAVPERHATQTRCGSRKRSGVPAQEGGGGSWGWITATAPSPFGFGAAKPQIHGRVFFKSK